MICATALPAQGESKAEAPPKKSKILRKADAEKLDKLQLERMVLALRKVREGEGARAVDRAEVLRKAHAAIAVDRAILTRHYEEKAQLLVELNLAKQIQENLLPQTLPDIPGYEIAAISRSADATGGDYYDVIPYDSDS